MVKFLRRGFFLLLLLLGGASFFGQANAQELVLDKQITAKAEVLEVLKQETKNIPGTDTKSNYQTLLVKILDGEEKGKEVTVENDYLNLEKGEIFYLVHTTNDLENRDYYSVSEPYRVTAVYFFVGLFIVCVICFGGRQGLRGIISLIASFFFIGYFLLPGITHGYSPVLVSIAVSSLIIILGSYITHGFNKTTTSAVVGMVVTIILTSFLAFFAISFARLSGFASEEAVYLNFDTRGQIDFAGLLLGGILIGLLGVLYDAAIGQAVSVDELHHVGPHLGRKAIYRRAIRIGREHIGALVNTLAIAYVGVSLPLLLLYSTSTSGFTMTINREIFATEIIRIMIGSIGLVLAVPITTLLAVLILIKEKPVSDPSLLEHEKQAIEEVEHTH